MGPVHLLPHQMFLLVPSPSEVPRRNWGRKLGRSSPEQFCNQNNQMTPLLIPRRFLKDIACKRWFLIRFFLKPPCQHNHPSELPRLFSLCNSKNDFSEQFSFLWSYIWRSFLGLTIICSYLKMVLLSLLWSISSSKRPSSIGKSSQVTESLKRCRLILNIFIQSEALFLLELAMQLRIMQFHADMCIWGYMHIIRILIYAVYVDMRIMRMSFPNGICNRIY